MKKTQLKDYWKYEKNIFNNEKIIHSNLYYDLFYENRFNQYYTKLKKTPVKVRKCYN